MDKKVIGKKLIIPVKKGFTESTLRDDPLRVECYKAGFDDVEFEIIEEFILGLAKFEDLEFTTPEGKVFVPSRESSLVMIYYEFLNLDFRGQDLSYIDFLGCQFTLSKMGGSVLERVEFDEWCTCKEDPSKYPYETNYKVLTNAFTKKLD